MKTVKFLDTWTHIIHEDIQIINKGGKESVLINLKYKVIYQLGELIENILVIDQPWGILVYNITEEQKYK